MNRSLGHIMITFLPFFFPSLALAQGVEAAHEADEGGGEVIYFQQLTVDPRSGAMSASVEGSTTVLLSSGSAFTIDQDVLEDPDGNLYSATVDVYQDSVDQPVIYEYRLWRQGVAHLTDDEVTSLWRANHPEVTDTDIASFRTPAGDRDDTGAMEDTGRSVTSTDGVYVQPELEAWLAAGDDGSEVFATILIPEDEPLDLAAVAWDLAESDPVAFLDSYEDRLDAIEQRKTAIAAGQRSLISTLEELGASHSYSYWLFDGLDVYLSHDALRYVLDNAIGHVFLFEETEDEDNTGNEIRSAAGIQQYLDYGYDASAGGMRSTNNEVYLGVVDTKILLNHPAWQDCGDTATCMADCGSASCPSRLLSAYEWDGSAWDVMSGTPASTHGTNVTGQLLADLTDNQDPAYSSSTDQGARTGMSTEVVFSAVSHGQNAGIAAAIQQAVALGVDGINLSAGTGGPNCALSHTSIAAANIANLQGVFFTKSAGNDGYGATSCTVTAPGAGAGVFTVGAHMVRGVGDLTTAAIWENTDDPLDPEGSARGGDACGRSVIDLVAAAGREGDTATSFNSSGNATYARGAGATSMAAPVVAGAAANFRHYLVDMFSPWPSAWTNRNTAGLVFASMLLMGDGELESGTMGSGTAYDDLWGAGRLSMKMFNPTGMTAPWRFRLAVRTIYQSATDVIPLNPSDNGNQPIPDNVSELRVATWWYEPNLNQPPWLPIGVAQLDTQVCSDGGVCYPYNGTGPSKHRIWLGPVFGNDLWELKITGLSVPVSLDPNYHFGYAKRVVYAVLYWEG